MGGGASKKEPERKQPIDSIRIAKAGQGAQNKPLPSGGPTPNRKPLPKHDPSKNPPAGRVMKRNIGPAEGVGAVTAPVTTAATPTTEIVASTEPIAETVGSQRKPVEGTNQEGQEEGNINQITDNQIAKS